MRENNSRKRPIRYSDNDPSLARSNSNTITPLSSCPPTTSPLLHNGIGYQLDKTNICIGTQNTTTNPDGQFPSLTKMQFATGADNYVPIKWGGDIISDIYKNYVAPGIATVVQNCTTSIASPIQSAIMSAIILPKLPSDSLISGAFQIGYQTSATIANDAGPCIKSGLDVISKTATQKFNDAVGTDATTGLIVGAAVIGACALLVCSGTAIYIKCQKADPALQANNSVSSTAVNSLEDGLLTHEQQNAAHASQLPRSLLSTTRNNTGNIQSIVAQRNAGNSPRSNDLGSGQTSPASATERLGRPRSSSHTQAASAAQAFTHAL